MEYTCMMGECSFCSSHAQNEHICGHSVSFFALVCLCELVNFSLLLFFYYYYYDF